MRHGTFISRTVLLLSLITLTACGGVKSVEERPSSADQNNASDTTVPTQDTDPTPAPPPPVDSNNIPIAFNDNLSSQSGQAIEIDVLSNDQYITNEFADISINTSPNNGTVSVTSSNMVLYTPADGFTGADSFTYSLNDIDGDSSTATVNIDIQCSSGCPIAARMIRLEWGASPDADITGYNVYHGDASGRYTNITPVGNVLSIDVELTTSGEHFFSVTAVNSMNSESDYSEEYSITL